MDQETPKDTSPTPKPEKASDTASIPSVPIEPLETFRSDVEKYVRENDVSPGDLAKAEILKRQHTTGPAPSTLPPPPPPDPRAAILPNKEVHSPLNASRVSAGTLLQQESNATLPKTPAPPLPLPKKPPTATSPVETYRGDIQQYVQEKNVSAVTVAAAEERRRDENAAPIEVGSARTFSFRALTIVGGLALIAAALGAIIFVYITQRALPAQQAPVAPFIAVDQTITVPLPVGSARSDIMNALVQAKNNVSLSVGLVAQLLPQLTSGQPTISAQTFLSVLTPDMPPQLMRTIQPDFLLGVHSFDSNQPFILLSVDSYEDGYAGMLAWESTMRQDLSPFFEYAPSAPSAAPTATTTASSTLLATSSAPSSPAVLQTGFVDTIVENHEARAIEDTSGNIELLWTFLDRNTILIATNPNTVAEVLSRLKIAPTITTPSQ